jgi:hypothetical protein
MMLRSAADDSFATNVYDAPVLAPNCVPPQVAPSYCGECGSGLLLLEKAARLCQRTPRTLYRWVEQGQLHFCELADGTVMVCGRTLAEQVNEKEFVPAQLPGAAASRQTYSTNRIH